MNKAQKNIIVIALLVMSVIVIYPPKAFITESNYASMGRSFIFSDDGINVQIDTKRIIVELFAIIILAGGLVFLFGLKKMRSKFKLIRTQITKSHGFPGLKKDAERISLFIIC